MSDAKAGVFERIDQATIRQWLNLSSTAILCGALLIPFGALPAFDTGYYGLVAASIQWLHLCAGVGAIITVLGLLIAPNIVWSGIINPASLAIAAFAFLSAVSVISATHPWLVIFGSPQSGKGVLWFLDAAVYIALAWVIRDFKPGLTAVFLTALASTMAVVALQIFVANSETELLLRGGKSYAYLGLMLPFLVLLLDRGPLLRVGALAAWVTSIACVIVSENKSAIGIFLVLALAYGVTRYWPTITNWLSRIAFAVMFPLITVAALVIAYLVISFEFRGTFDSLDSRILIAKIVLAAQMDSSPWQWIFGHGWGHTQGALYRNLTASGADLLDNRWDFLWRDIFHSHNLVLELIYETGVVGLIAFFALLAWLVTATSPEKRAVAVIFVTGYLLLNSAWFEFAHTVPMLALAVFAILGKPICHNRRGAPKQIVSIICLTGVAIICLGAAISLNQFDSRVAPFKMDRFVLTRTDYPTELFPSDPRGDDFIRASVYRKIARKIDIGIQQHNKQVPAITALSAILDDIEARLATTRNPDLLLVGLVIFNDVHFNKHRKWILPAVQGREQLWDKLANRHLKLAPKRTDVLVVYLSWLVTNKNFDQAKRVLANILHRSPDEPIATYFQGVIATHDADEEAKRRGLLSINRAVENGVERYLEVPDWLKKLASEAN